MSNKKYRLPPRDSWLTLPPGGEVQLDDRIIKEWKKATRECREIRGNVLAACFEIEYLLDQVITETLIPSTTNNPDGRDIFDELFLKGPASNFRTKIDVLRKLRLRVDRLQSLIPEDMFRQLDAVRQLRNDFAHYPVTFEPSGEVPNQNLVPVLVSRRGRFILDNAFIQSEGANFTSVMAGLESAFKSLTPQPAEVDKAPDRGN